MNTIFLLGKVEKAAQNERGGWNVRIKSKGSRRMIYITAIVSAPEKPAEEGDIVSAIGELVVTGNGCYVLAEKFARVKKATEKSDGTSEENVEENNEENAEENTGESSEEKDDIEGTEKTNKAKEEAVKDENEGSGEEHDEKHGEKHDEEHDEEHDDIDIDEIEF
jgi:hypothetical protein